MEASVCVLSSVEGFCGLGQRSLFACNNTLGLTCYAHHTIRVSGGVLQTLPFQEQWGDCKGTIYHAHCVPVIVSEKLQPILTNLI